MLITIEQKLLHLLDHCEMSYKQLYSFSKLISDITELTLKFQLSF